MNLLNILHISNQHPEYKIIDLKKLESLQHIVLHLSSH